MSMFTMQEIFSQLDSGNAEFHVRKEEIGDWVMDVLSRLPHEISLVSIYGKADVTEREKSYEVAIGGKKVYFPKNMRNKDAILELLKSGNFTNLLTLENKPFLEGFVFVFNTNTVQSGISDVAQWIRDAVEDCINQFNKNNNFGYSISVAYLSGNVLYEEKPESIEITFGFRQKTDVNSLWKEYWIVPWSEIKEQLSKCLRGHLEDSISILLKGAPETLLAIPVTEFHSYMRRFPISIRELSSSRARKRHVLWELNALRIIIMKKSKRVRHEFSNMKLERLISGDWREWFDALENRAKELVKEGSAGDVEHAIKNLEVLLVVLEMYHTSVQALMINETLFEHISGCEKDRECVNRVMMGYLEQLFSPRWENSATLLLKSLNFVEVFKAVKAAREREVNNKKEAKP